jgi:hypothetical protein
MQFAFVLMTGCVGISLIVPVTHNSSLLSLFPVCIKWDNKWASEAAQTWWPRKTVQTFIKYVRLLPRYCTSRSCTFIQLFYNEMPTFQPFDSFTPCLQCTKEANLVLCGNALVWFPDDSPLQTETCTNIMCDIITYISKEQFWTLCWFSVMN